MVVAKSMFGLLCLIVVVDAQGKTTEMNSLVVQCAVYSLQFRQASYYFEVDSISGT